MNQGNYPDKNSQTEEQGETGPEAELTHGFTFDISPNEAKELQIGQKQVGDVCGFIVEATVISVAPDGTLTFKANEIEWDDADEQVTPSDLNGASKMYKAGMPAPKKPKVTYVKLATEQSVS